MVKGKNDTNARFHEFSSTAVENIVRMAMPLLRNSIDGWENYGNWESSAATVAQNELKSGS